MINTSIRSAKRWYYDAVIGGIILEGFTKREAKRMVREYRLKHMLNKYPETTLHYPIEATIDEILNAPIFC